MIWVEEHADGWHAECAECGWTAGPATEAEVTAQADAHDREMGEVPL